MRRLSLLTLALLACSPSSTAPPAELKLAHGIVRGNNQVAPAGTLQLTAPVIELLVRTPSGQLTLMHQRPARPWADHLLDVLVPAAYAQTIVTGSPVPGAVVCAVSPNPAHPLTAFNPCTNTDSLGQAIFFFAPGTIAGVALSEIRGTVTNQPAVFDTARATILPGPATDWVPQDVTTQQDQVATAGYNIYGNPGDTLHTARHLGNVVDQYSNFLVRSGVVTSGTVLILQARRTNATPALSDPELVPGEQVTLRPGDRAMDLIVNGVSKTFTVHLFIPVSLGR